MPRTEIAASAVNELGVKIVGSAREGHDVKVTRSFGLSEIFGTREEVQLKAFVSQSMQVLAGSEASGNDELSDQREFMLSIVRDISPRDPVERMLAVQMAATHIATIRAARWLAGAENLQQSQAHSNAYAKLTRTFVAQTEALRKQRNGGEQRVTVQHVSVGDGGQAIVGNVKHGGGGGNET